MRGAMNSSLMLRYSSLHPSDDESLGHALATIERGLSAKGLSQRVKPTAFRAVGSGAGRAFSEHRDSSHKARGVDGRTGRTASAETKNGSRAKDQRLHSE